MYENRRSFLKKAGRTALGFGCGLPLLSTGCSSLKEEPAGEGASPNQWAMVIDVRKCLQREVREECIKACNHAHNVPASSTPAREVKWIWDEAYEKAFPDQIHAQTEAALKKKYGSVKMKGPLEVLVLCNHCTHPACVKVCPTAATWKRDDGIVMMDVHRCIGCRNCMVACPYGARSFNWGDAWADAEEKPPSNYPTRSRGVVEKCTFCAERIRTSGENENPVPACVEAARRVADVPQGEHAPLTFGNLSEPDSEVSRLLGEKHAIRRRVGLGTGPNVYYII
jgi:molybdopterin-containing oxidoreductase family iron-sulfur binding subunit